MNFAKVHVLDVPYAADKAYTYRNTLPEITPGCFVLVPFGKGNKFRAAVVTGISENEEETDGIFKDILCRLCEDVTLSGDELSLVRFVADRTFCSFGDAVKRIVPPTALDTASELLAFRADPMRPLTAKEEEILDVVRSGPVRTDRLLSLYGDNVQKEIKHLLHLELIEKIALVKKVQGATNEIAFPIDNADEEELAKPRTPEAMKEIYGIILEHDGFPVRELEDEGYKRAHIKALEKRGLIQIVRREVIRNHYDSFEGGAPLPVLSEEQEAAFEKLTGLLEQKEPKAALLYGVTGSGKTSVILHLCKKAVENGKSAIVLVPEIGLTWQAVSTYASVFGKRLAILHSGLSDGERLDSLKRIRRKEVDLVLGTRSAVFAPLANLGLIVIDEEQEHTYKSDMSPKYNAKDIAAFRTAQCGGLMVLASATPSVESYYKAETGKYELVKLTRRYGRAVLPEVLISDMREEPVSEEENTIGSVLEKELKDNRENGKQSVLLLNRRGYNAYAICRMCGKTILCPSCSVAMTYHKLKYAGYLICHYCGKRMPAPKICPECSSSHMYYGGYGTQRIEDELSQKLGDVKISRMDADTTKGRFSQDELVESFAKGESDVLVGTQMIAKGHNFPKVTLVGVIDADTSLFNNDFRSGERTFSLLTQVIGRAGRGEDKGRAVIQTRNPYNPVIQLASKQDYDAFYRNEIQVRKALTFPPFCDITVLTFSSEDEEALRFFADQFSDGLKNLLTTDYTDVKLQFFGPFDASVYKLRNHYRRKIVIKHINNKRYREMIAFLLHQFSKSGSGKVTFSVDINPVTV